MQHKRFTILIALFSLLLVAIIALINFIVDPFQQYRVDTFYPISYDCDKQRYKNGGFAKNFSYDSLILGTSMTENFILNEVEEKLNFNKVIKLSLSGGSAKEQSTTLKTAIQNHKNLKNVLWGIDAFIFVGDPDNLSYGEGTFPFYLYDNNIFNDYQYLLSINTLSESFDALTNQYLNKDKFLYDQNRMYQWQHKFEKNFTQQNRENAWEVREDFLKFEDGKQTFSYMKKSFDLNFLELIKSNQKIHFTIFFPPYSVLTYQIFKQRGQIEDFLDFKKYIYTSLIECKNVTMYDFQSAEEIVIDLNNYKDLSHYHQKVNSWILNQIRDTKYQVTKDNMDTFSKSIRESLKKGVEVNFK